MTGMRIKEENELQQMKQESMDVHFNFTLSDVIQILWKGKWWVALPTLSFAILSVFLSIRMPNVYYAEAVLSPTATNYTAALANQFGGLASLAGINLSSNQTNRTDLALEILKSRRFIAKFISQHNLSVPLIAAKGWDHEKNQLLIDNEIYDSKKDEWVRKVKYPYSKTPSDWELYQKFRDILSIEKDPKNGMVHVGVEFYSPYIANDWVHWLVEDINQEIRIRDKQQADRNLEYLDKELKNTNLASMREIFSNLVEEQYKNKMLAEVTPDYAFTVVDPSVASELKSGPKRSLIVLTVTMLSFIVASVLVLAFYTSGVKREGRVGQK